MNTVEKLNFLNKYTMSKNKVELLNLSEINEIEKDIIPNEWREIFSKVDVKLRINNLIYIRKVNVGIEMSNTISFLEEFLVNVELIRIGKRYSILYTIINQDGEVEYYQGNNPYEKKNNKKLDEFFKSTPISIQNFYNNVHNGFYYYPSKGMGLSSYNDIFCLADEEWGIIDDIGEKNLKLNLDTSFGFFTNSAGTYVVIDFDKDINNSILWSAKDEPEYNCYTAN